MDDEALKTMATDLSISIVATLNRSIKRDYISFKELGDSILELRYYYEELLSNIETETHNNPEQKQRVKTFLKHKIDTLKQLEEFNKEKFQDHDLNQLRAYGRKWKAKTLK